VASTTRINAVDFDVVAGATDDVLLVADAQSVIRVPLDTLFDVTHEAGTGIVGDAGDGGSAVNATFTRIAGVLATASGVLVLDAGAGRVRRFTVGGTVEAVARVGPPALTPNRDVDPLALAAAGDTVLVIRRHSVERIDGAATAPVIRAFVVDGRDGDAGDVGPFDCDASHCLTYDVSRSRLRRVDFAADAATVTTFEPEVTIDDVAHNVGDRYVFTQRSPGVVFAFDALAGVEAGVLAQGAFVSGATEVETVGADVLFVTPSGLRRTGPAATGTFGALPSVARVVVDGARAVGLGVDGAVFSFDVDDFATTAQTLPIAGQVTDIALRGGVLVLARTDGLFGLDLASGRLGTLLPGDHTGCPLRIRAVDAAAVVIASECDGVLSRFSFGDPG
jgi:hypothetical protein